MHFDPLLKLKKFLLLRNSHTNSSEKPHINHFEWRSTKSKKNQFADEIIFQLPQKQFFLLFFLCWRFSPIHVATFFKSVKVTHKPVPHFNSPIGPIAKFLLRNPNSYLHLFFIHRSIEAYISQLAQQTEWKCGERWLKRREKRKSWREIGSSSIFCVIFRFNISFGDGDGLASRNN